MTDKTDSPGFDHEVLEETAELLRAVAHPLRILIIELLADDKQLTVSQIQKELKIEQAVASHHLIILKNKGVLKCRRSGKTIVYSLRNQHIAEIIKKARKAV